MRTATAKDLRQRTSALLDTVRRDTSTVRRRPVVLSDITDRVVTVTIRWARPATKHRVSRGRSRYVIEHCGLRFRVAPPSGELDERLLCLGDDADGVPPEVMAVELSRDDLYVVHAMPLRAQYRSQYEEAKEWRL